MWYGLYNIGLLMASPVILALLLAKARCRRGLPQRLGRVPLEKDADRPVIWVHAVSLGEVTAAVPFIVQLSRRAPHARILVTTVTETGREAVERRLAGIAEHRYAPLDFPWVVARVVASLNPALFVFVETELWPNLLRTLSRRRVPVALVNGRLSSRSFRGYRVLRAFMRQVLSFVSLCLMQSDRDVERIVALGARPDRVVRTGNIKFDQATPLASDAEALPRELLLGEGEALMVAGSTHPGEEEALLACYRALHTRFPGLVLLLAPRHIERAAKVEAIVRAQGLVAIRRTELARERRCRGPRVVILDTRGELAGVYRHAVVTFVGGTLVPIGGHNLLEPAAWEKPVFFGPYTDHCADIATLLRTSGGGRQVHTGRELTAVLDDALRNPAVLKEMGQAAGRVILENRGALDRTMARLEPLIPQRLARTRPCECV